MMLMTTPITFGWRVPDFPEPGDDSAAFRKQIFNFTAALERGGLDSIWVGDHFFPWPGEVDQSVDTIEAWTTLTYLMAAYPRLKGGTIVLSQGYRPPALLAKMSANLQWLSGGRFTLGIGAGWKENEYKAYGYDFPPPGVRLAQLDEAVQVIRKMWTEKCPTFHGTYYHIENACVSPQPDPVPTLLIGGDGPKKTLRIVAQYADWCNLNNVPPDYCRERLGILRKHCQDVGRNYDEILKTLSSDCVATARTHEEAVRMKEASFFGKFQPFVGTPDEVTQKIQTYVDLGFRHFIFRFVDYPKTDGAELFMKEVMPRFQK
jgi:alkanesulfonate monooxygenase SsuD/methylene tetrahydromethanopterin reductase-like flavin-dependent oxidoreductase (luciferase family)